MDTRTSAETLANIVIAMLDDPDTSENDLRLLRQVAQKVLDEND